MVVVVPLSCCEVVVDHSTSMSMLKDGNLLIWSVWNAPITTKAKTNSIPRDTAELALVVVRPLFRCLVVVVGGDDDDDDDAED